MAKPTTCAEAALENDKALAYLREFLEEGETVITHTLCGGIIAEHVFIGIDDERRLSGYPTSDTMRLNEELGGHMASIAPVNVTHLDRIPLRALGDLHPNRDQGPSGEEVDVMVAAHAANEAARIETTAKLLAEWVDAGCEEVPQDLARRIIQGDDELPF